MPLTDELVARARRGKKPALAELLEQMYPAVHRLAHGLTGRADVARGTIRYVMVHAVRHAKGFRDAAEAKRWFFHFTVLTSRRAEMHAPEAGHDTLISGDDRVRPAYVAFIRGLRGLEIQQREAFLLYRGEGLDERGVATAMDCSTRAAAQHLHAAAATLEVLSGTEYEGDVERMRVAYQSLKVDEDDARPAVRSAISEAVRPARVRMIFRLLLLAAVVAGGIYALKWLGYLH